MTIGELRHMTLDNVACATVKFLLEDGTELVLKQKEITGKMETVFRFQNIPTTVIGVGEGKGY